MPSCKRTYVCLKAHIYLFTGKVQKVPDISEASNLCPSAHFELVNYDNFSWVLWFRNKIIVPWEILHFIKTENQPGWHCLKYDEPTLLAWLKLYMSMSMTIGGLWHIGDHSQSISLEKLDTYIKHVTCVCEFLKLIYTCGTRPGRHW